MRNGKHIAFAAVILACCLASVSGRAEAGSDLIGQLTQKLSITPQQATAGAGALFSLAKGRLSAEDFGKIAAVVPGMDKLLAAAPKPAAAAQVAEASAPAKAQPAVASAPGGSSAFGAVTSAVGAASTLGKASTVAAAMPAATGGTGGLTGVAGAFKSLGLSPEMVGQFIPILTQFVGAKGGLGAASLLAGALK